MVNVSLVSTTCCCRPRPPASAATGKMDMHAVHGAGRADGLHDSWFLVLPRFEGGSSFKAERDRMKMLIAFERLFVCPPTMNERKLPPPPLRHCGTARKRSSATAQLSVLQSRNLSADSPPGVEHACVHSVVTNWQSINCPREVSLIRYLVGR